MRNQPAARPATRPGLKVAPQYNHFCRALAPSAGAAGRPRWAGRKLGARQAVSRRPPMPKIHQGRASFFGWRRSEFPARPAPGSSVLKIETAREGVRVIALTAEMITEAAMVRANWR